MDPKQPSGNTSSLGWPSCCHIPYWRNEGCTFLSAVDVFDFLGIRCRHGYGCIECHLECSGISDAFAKSTAVNDDDDRHCFLSLEAFIHLLFGGHPPCCVNAVTNNLVNEIRHFIIEVLVKYPSPFSTNQAVVSTQETCDMSCTGACIKLETLEGADEEGSSEAVRQAFLHIADSLPQSQQNVTNCDSVLDDYPDHRMYNMSPVAVSRTHELSHHELMPREFSDSDTNAMYCVGLEDENVASNRTNLEPAGNTACSPHTEDTARNPPVEPFLLPTVSSEAGIEHAYVSDLASFPISDTSAMCAAERDATLGEKGIVKDSPITHRQKRSRLGCRRKRKEHFYKCHKCGENFASTASAGYSAHICNSCSSETSSHTCVLCGTLCDSSVTLVTHLSSHVSTEEPIKCPICRKVVASKRSLFYHLSYHSGHAPYKCKYCKKGFISFSNLSMHLRTHKDSQLLCEYCNEEFECAADLLNHRDVHRTDRPHQCTYCSKAYKNSYGLAMHVRMHTNHRPYQCVQCGKAFTRPDVLADHVRTHGDDKPFKCLDCGDSFKTRRELSFHRLKICRGSATVSGVALGAVSSNLVNV